MRRTCVIAMLAACAALCGANHLARSETPTAPAAAPVPVTSPISAAPVQFFQAGFDDLMTLLIQPRHLKLYYAGTHSNWELAAAELADLRSAFGRVASSFPTYQGIGVDEALWSIIAPKLQALDTAIASADAKRFVTAYTDLTAACNACHAYMEHPFLVIKVPDAAPPGAYPNQEFAPSP